MAIKITKRERYAIWIASGVMLLFLLSQFVVVPIMNKRERLIRGLQAQSQAYQDMLVLKGQYEAIQKTADEAQKNMAKRKKGFTLFSFLDQLAGETGLKDNIAYMKPSVSAQENSPYRTALVETKLQAVTLEALTRYIYRIETSENIVRLKGLSITKTGKQVGYVDAVLLVETVEL